MRRIYLVAWPLSIVVAVIVCCLLHGRKRLPPTVAVRVDTVQTTVPGRVVTVTRTDPVTGKLVDQLRSELAGANRTIGGLLGKVSNLQQQHRALLDTLACRQLDTIPAILRVDKTPGGLTAMLYRDGVASTWSIRNSRERWSLFASGPQGSPRLRQNWPIADFGLSAWANLKTPPAEWMPNTAIGIGLVVKRWPVTVCVGPEYDGTLRLAGRVAWGVWF